MELTAERKAYIDSLSLEALLERWRNAPVGDKWFQDETGRYWSDRIKELRTQNAAAYTDASKRIGWEGRDT